MNPNVTVGIDDALFPISWDLKGRMSMIVDGE